MTAQNGTNPEAKKVIGQDLEGKRVCIKGGFTDAPRYEYEGWLQDIGATLVPEINEMPDILIAGVGVRDLEAHAEELGIQVLDEDEAMESLATMNEEISPEWAERIINRLIASVPKDDGEYYYQFSNGSEKELLGGKNLEELRSWLTQRIGVNSDFQMYVEPEDALSIDLSSIRLDPENNVTLWFWDTECGRLCDYEEAQFNTQEEALKFAIYSDEQDYGGHLSVIKVVEKKGDQTTVLVGDELEDSEYPHWGGDWEYDESCGMSRDEFYEQIRHGYWDPKGLGKDKASAPNVDSSHINVKDKKVCITGKLNLKRSEIENQLNSKGAKVVSSVSKNTDLLIVGADAGSKLNKAQELGVQVLTENDAVKQGIISCDPTT